MSNNTNSANTVKAVKPQILTAEFAAAFIDWLEDWLDEKRVVIPNEDRDREMVEEGEELPSEDNIGDFAQIYGEDFDDISHKLEDVMEELLISAGIDKSLIKKDTWHREEDA